MCAWGLARAAWRVGCVAGLATLLAVGSMARGGQEDVFDLPDDDPDAPAARDPRSKPTPPPEDDDDVDRDPAAKADDDGDDWNQPESDDRPAAKPKPKPKPKPPAERRPVPTRQQQSDAERTIKEVYKADYAQEDKRAALPGKLLSQARESSDDAAAEFVLLREARDLAAEQGDFATATRAADALAEGFRIDVLAMKAALLARTAKSARSPEAAAAAVTLALDLVDAALERDDFKGAEQFAATAKSLAKRSKDKALSAFVGDRGAEVRARSNEFGKVRAAQAKLTTDVDDPAANLLVGRYLCLTKDEWAKGLPLLAKGADPVLQDLALQELSLPSEALEMLKLADGWWAAAEKAPASARAGARGRAAHWYRAAEPELSGLKKELAAQRIAEAAAGPGGAAARRAGPVDLLRLVDPKQDAVAHDWTVKRGVLLSPPEGQASVQFPYVPPEEYDFKVVFSFTGVGTNTLVLQMLACQGKPFIWVMGRGGFTFHYLRGAGIGANRSTVNRPWIPQKGRRYTSIVKVRKDGARAYIDGQLISELKTDYTDVEAQPFWALRRRDLLGVGAGDCVVAFHSAELAEITGTGKPTREE